MNQALYLVIGPDIRRVQDWLSGYAIHWKHHDISFSDGDLILEDRTAGHIYRGIEGVGSWWRLLRALRPEAIILLKGWIGIRGIGFQLDLWKAEKIKIIEFPDGLKWGDLANG